MKVHKVETIGNEAITEQGNACCGPTTIESNQSADSCCEQPVDDSVCCDKTASKEENSKTTGCC